MVQGWRRYEWKHWAGVEPFELKYLPEQGIELHGQVVSMVRSKPRPDVQVTSFLTKRGEEDNPTDQNTSCFDVFIRIVQDGFLLFLRWKENGI